MAETPKTPTPSLAERLVTEAGILSNLGYPGRVNETIGLLAETAVQVLDMETQLRQLDRIKAALGPVSNIRRVGAQLPDCTSYSLASLGQWLTGVADALEADDGA